MIFGPSCKGFKRKIIPIFTKAVLTGVKLIVKSGTFKPLLYLALITDSFHVTFQVSNVFLQLLKGLDRALRDRRFKASERKDRSILIDLLYNILGHVLFCFCLFCASVFVNSICSISSRFYSRQTSKANANFSLGLLSWTYMK